MRENLKKAAGYVTRNYFRAGFFSVTIGVAVILYGLALFPMHHSLLYWMGYFEMGIGAGIVYLGILIYRSHRQLEKTTKTLAEIQKEIEMQEKGINYF